MARVVRAKTFNSCRPSLSALALATALASLPAAERMRLSSFTKPVTVVWIACVLSAADVAA
jgi:hypothetical protein